MWQSTAHNMPDSGVFSDTPAFKNHIGGLLSDSKANSYSQFFTGTIHSFTWADGSYYTQSDFETNFVEGCCGWPDCLGEARRCCCSLLHWTPVRRSLGALMKKKWKTSRGGEESNETGIHFIIRNLAYSLL